MAQQQEANIEQLVETLSALSVLDLSNLKKALEEKWDVKAAAGAPMMMAAPAAAAGESAAAEEATDFQVILEEAPADKKIAIIKVVREITGLGLKEAKELVEGAPKPVKDSAPKAEAEEIKKKITEAGGKVALKGV
ncbi:MAG: 50S ribosomal protein L7/L12 [Simkania sp.]|uniref:Large ribosomal subunit protein bL12 n=1 Tax=Simkania negevensis (strain ATCC VR-1471 / DSM 27360 / Z) TaxID=331113 RepID=F8L975_SIMNZ|nr:50S ribosomal protein L7/L12 [Simkania negevensis]MCB1074196.1 50S ribosomal protein L7/L12 [Simkania sp.]MCB1083317.1 50S ribosomal protein L7/L12 [Simkania sp.]CCB89390.1 50S ribosomal protein L7/L12 [Simkania negevensis Z]